MPTIIATGASSAGNYGFIRGKSVFLLSITTQNNVNLRTLAIAGGWNASSKVVATVSGNIGSSSTGTASFIITGAFPSGVDLTINSGVYVCGAGGNGSSGGVGGAGGGALQITSYTGGSITITNNGVIGGGGGGGSQGNGGGGGAGIPPGTGFISGTTTSGGSGNSDSCNAYSLGAGGAAGSNGSFPGGGGGLGGNGAYGDICGSDADPIPPATNVDPGGIRFSGYTPNGGTAGYAVSGTSSITWLVTGTRYGTVS